MARTLPVRRTSVDVDENESNEAVQDNTGSVGTPQRRKRSEDPTENDAPSVTVAGGWGAYRKTADAAASTGGGGVFFKVEKADTSYLLKFVNDSPYASCMVHWVDQKPIMHIGDDCALCNSAGHTPKPQHYFNVIDMLDDEPTLKVWQTSAAPANEIEDRLTSLQNKFEEGDERREINYKDYYFEVSKKKSKNNFFDYTVALVKARDLEEDWGVAPLTEEEFDDLSEGQKDASSIKVPTKADVREAAKELLKD